MLDTYDNKKKYTYFVTGGGTGGHIYPAVAICDELRKDPRTKEVYYVGNKNNLEFEIAKKYGYNFLHVNVAGMPRKFGFQAIVWFFQFQFAIFKALYYIKKYKPNAIFGTGGYVSAPALFAGGVDGVPIMIHDGDAQPGIVSQYIAPSAQCISLAFEDSKKHITGKNIRINGNPIRSEFKTLTKENARKSLNLQDKLTLCIMGGSQGAHSLNLAAVGALKELASHDIQIIFQTGKKNYDNVIIKLRQEYPEFEKNKNLIVKPYFDNMVAVLKSSDIAVSRAGSLSISELCACGIASILIPYPHAAADHQRENAKYMLEKGAALYLEDADVSKETLLTKVEELLNDREKLSSIQNNTLLLARPDATKDIIAQLKGITK